MGERAAEGDSEDASSERQLYGKRATVYYPHMAEKFTGHEGGDGGNEGAPEFKPGDLVTISPDLSEEYLMGRGMQELKAGETYKILKIEELQDVEDDDELVLSAYLGPVDADITLLDQYSSGDDLIGAHYPVSILPLEDVRKTSIN